jgi:cobyrinic acid a,c-diamide synthase
MPTPIAFGRRQKHPAPGEEIYRHGSLTASYLHLFFPSNAWAVACLFKKGLMKSKITSLNDEGLENVR